MEEGGSLRDGILERMRLPGYRPLNKGELARDLGIKSDRRTDLRAELAASMAFVVASLLISRASGSERNER